jgi:hypothetical protein
MISSDEAGITDDELAKIGTALWMAEADGSAVPGFVLLVRLLATTGMRLGEALALTWPNVDLPGRAIRLHAAKTKGRARTVHLGAAAVAILDAIAERDGYVVHGLDPSKPFPVSTAEKAWARLRERAGIPEARLHDLHHTAGTFAALSGANAFAVRDLLGHRTLSNEKRRRAREARDRAIDHEQRRRNRIMRFAERQFIARRWIAFVNITDWCAQSTTAAGVDEEKKAKDLAYRRLADSILNGELEKGGRSKILYLDPTVMDDGALSQWWLTREQFEVAFEVAAMPPAPSGPFAVLNCCWVPRELARNWLESHGYPWPSHFAPNEISLSAESAPHNPPQQRRFGPKPTRDKPQGGR